MIRGYFFLLITFLFISCNKNTKEEVEDIVSENNQLKPVYNQAYQENYASDKIQDIISNAKNAYVLIDPFDGNNADFIQKIKMNGNEVGAYISIGTGEKYRDDFEKLKPFLVAKPWELWNDEYFVNTTTTGIIDVMKKRIDKIASWGCDWLEFDNMDWIFDDVYRKTYGFKVTKEEGIKYYNTLCEYARSKGLKCMAKNTVEGAVNFSGVLYESFHDNKNWWDTSGALQFLNEGKLVIVNHYNETDCDKVYSDYKKLYNSNLSFICESAILKKYVHYNE